VTIDSISDLDGNWRNHSAKNNFLVSTAVGLSDRLKLLVSILSQLIFIVVDHQLLII